MGKVKADTSPPPLANLTGLWGEFGLPSASIKPPLLARSDVPAKGAAWMRCVTPPRLDAPDFDFDSLASYVTALRTTITALQTEVSLETIENNKQQKKADFQKAEDQQKVADQKAKDAAEVAKKAMVLEWLSAVAAVIGSVLAAIGASVITGGLAAGIAIVGVMMAVQTLTNTAIKQAQMDGHKITTTDALGKEHNLSLSWGLAVDMAQAKDIKDGNILRNDGKGHVIDANGKIMTKEQLADAADKNPFLRIRTEEELGKERLGITLFIEIGIAVAMIGCGVRSMVTAGKNAAEAVEKSTKSVRLGIEASQKTWERFGRWSEGLSAATEVVGGISDAAKGGIDIRVAELQLESSNASTEQFFYEKKMKVAMTVMHDLQEICKNQMHSFNDTYEAMSQQVKDLDDLRVSISRNINKTAAAA
ncbi:Secretion system effector C (SseC) like family protein [Variovorax sp. PBL-H6]|uniref:hypothetical protein n=1 Tax=Variovorax sp. PBL-H6 TaxID=434009 RepID=UPI001318DE69|nr:hypothetical protein [Variovorax sp. PBL-H6]VTU22747.1 Secretion system effector C (SseC) like family protein [Variovorax sp. PBL-H6]